MRQGKVKRERERESKRETERERCINQQNMLQIATSAGFSGVPFLKVLWYASYEQLLGELWKQLLHQQSGVQTKPQMVRKVMGLSKSCTATQSWIKDFAFPIGNSITKFPF